jgi:hypothetical protein
MSSRILLHVGTPKTGTSYFQDVLHRNRPALLRSGISYPGSRFDAHFLAALDLLGLPWGGLEHEAAGAWEDLASTVRETPGTAIISHEILSTATPAQAARAIASLGGGPGGHAEVHVLVSARDLVRQIPAEWQENVKHRSKVSYAGFLERIRDPERGSRIGSWFWGAQELPAILDRWARDLPPERVHVITVPPAGAAGEGDSLWDRFATAFGLDGLNLDLDGERSNPSLGAAETALIRRINRRANAAVPPPVYRPLVRELLAHQTLSKRTTTPRLALPPDQHPWVQDLSRAWAAELAERGYDVVGDLADLIGAPPTTDYVDPDRPRERVVASAGVEAIRALLLEHMALAQERDRLREELDQTQLALEKSFLRPTYRLRAKIVRRLETSGGGKAALKAYRGARGRNSRSA